MEVTISGGFQWSRARAENVKLERQPAGQHLNANPPAGSGRVK
jgi:hypothetical protein